MLKKMKVLTVLAAIVFSINARADVTCVGTIEQLVKWSSSEDLSILIEGTGRYIKFTDKTSVSTLLMAYAAKKTVRVHFNDDNITSCSSGWPNYTVHTGYFIVED